MSKLEIIVTLFTIVYGLTLTDLFSSLHKLIKARKNVKWNWLPLLLAWYIFLVILKNWWAMAIPGNNIEEYTIVTFIVYGHVMILLFLMVSVVLPDQVPEEGINLKAYYFQHHRYLWSLMSAVAIISILIAIVPKLAESTPLNIPNLIAFLVYLMMNFLLIFSKKYWLHAVLIILNLVIILMEILHKLIY